MNKKEVILIIVLLVIGLSLRIFLTSCYYWDELSYLQHAEIISGKVNNFNEFDFRPPVLPIIISFLYIIWHNPLIANIFLSLVSTFSIFVIYLLGKEMFDKKTGLLAALFLTFWPMHIFLSRQILVHTLALLWGMLFLLLLKKSEKQEKGYWLLCFSGAFLGLSVLTRFTYLILIPVLIVNYCLFFKKYNLKKLLSFGVGFILMILPYLTWAYVTYGSPFYTFNTGQLMADWSSIEPWWFYLSNINIVLPLMGFLGIALWIFFIIREKTMKREEIVLLSWLVLPFVYLSALGHKETRFLAIAILPLIILSVIGFKRLYEHINHKKVAIALMLVLLIIPVIFIGGYNPFPRDCNSDAKFTSEWIMNNSLNGTIYVQNFYPYFGYYTDKKIVIAPLNKTRFLDRNQNFFIENGYFIYFEAQNRSSSFPSWTELNNDTRFSLVEELKNHEGIYIFRVNKL